MPRLPTALTTQRLTLRRYHKDDAGWYCDMARRNKDHLSRYERGNAVMRINTPADARDVIETFARDAEAGLSCFLGAFRTDSDAFVGQIYIGVGNADLPAFIIGYFCEASHLRQGYIGEAAAASVKALFETCDAMRVGLGCDDTNIASRRIAERLGMRREGHIRANKRNPDGTITGSLLYGLLRDEYRAQEAVHTI